MSPEQWSPERRRLARRLHPDLGGDPDTYIAAMRELDERQASAPPEPQGSAGSGSTVAYATARNRAARALRGHARAVSTVVRQRLPRRWPGTRRYGRL